MKQPTQRENDQARAALCEVDQLLPMIRETDGGMNGKGHDFQYRCYHCRNFRRCRAHGVATETQTHCYASPSNFRVRKDVA